MGEVFAGRYELLDPIGEGGMGSVWRGEDRRTGQIVAVKLLRQSDAGSLLRFIREQALRIDHEHVVTPLSWAGEDDRVLFAMPLIEGGSVSTLLGDYGALPPSYAAELLRQLFLALEAVHRAGVVHRDVKPANLLLDATGTARPHLWLSDFGIAVPLNEPRLTRPSVVLGTPGYVAPEALAGASPEPRQDLYSAGMVGWQLLLGELPTASAPPDPARTAGIPEAFRRLLTDLTSHDPSQRPATAREARERLEAVTPRWRDGQSEIEVFNHARLALESDLPGEVELAATEPASAPAPGTSGGPGTTARVSPATTTPVRHHSPPVVAPTEHGASDPHQEGTPSQGSSPPSADGTADRRAPNRLALTFFAAAAVLAVVIGLVVWEPWNNTGDDPTQSGIEHRDPPPDAPGVGDGCTFADVGVREVASDGSVVRCVLDDHGTYHWTH